LYYFKLYVIKVLSTTYCRLYFRFLGISLGEGSVFYGIPFIYLHPQSKIMLGKSIKFRTARTSNLIGIKQRSMISTILKSAEISIGDNCSFSAAVIASATSITIGNNVMMGANVLITDTDWHSMSANERQHGIPETKPIIISDNVFIGYSSTILKGVSIGNNSVIGANSVVTKNIPPNVIAAGNPCKVIKMLNK
jgi:acetyltransferase-like isoleucine patch superfamily enzyme